MRAWAFVQLGVAVWAAGALGGPWVSAAAAQAAPDLRGAHAACARSMVRIDRVDGTFGSGWVVELGGRRYVVTNRHVVEGETDPWIEFDGGSGSLGRVVYLSPRIDLALLEAVEGEIPAEPLRFVADEAVRGERVVIGGNPGGLSFITTEGVIAGVIAGTPVATAACGAGNACFVVDAEAEPGSSGGPVLDHSGFVIGMIWGVYTGASFSLAIPAETLAEELVVEARAALADARRRRRR